MPRVVIMDCSRDVMDLVIFDTIDQGNHVDVIADIPISGPKLFVRLRAEATAP